MNAPTKTAFAIKTTNRAQTSYRTTSTNSGWTRVLTRATKFATHEDAVREIGISCLDPATVTVCWFMVPADEPLAGGLARVVDDAYLANL